MTAVYKKEIKSYFSNMTGYVFIAFMLVICGIFSTAVNFRSLSPNFEYVLQGVQFIFLIIIPILTMRSFADEKHQKTDQLLYSLPLKLSNIVIGKFLAMLSVYGISLAVMAFYPLILSIFGPVNFAATYSALFAYLLLGAALIAIGMFISTLTDSQLIAAVLSFGAFLILYLMSDLARMVPSKPSASFIAFALIVLGFGFVLYFLTKESIFSVIVCGILEGALLALYLIKGHIFETAFPNALGKLSIFNRFIPFTDGMFDLTAIIYYITTACLFIFFSIQSLEKKRWS